MTEIMRSVLISIFTDSHATWHQVRVQVLTVQVQVLKNCTLVLLQYKYQVLHHWLQLVPICLPQKDSWLEPQVCEVLADYRTHFFRIASLRPTKIG